MCKKEHDGLTKAPGMGDVTRLLDQWNAGRRAVARQYNTHLAGTGVITPEDSGETHVWHVYAIRVPGGKRDAMKDFLWERGIGTGIHYPVPLHLQPAYKYLGYKPGSLPVAEEKARQILSLPMYPELTKGQIKTIVKYIKEAIG